MSLEVAIQENTAAIRELITAISKGMPVAASTVAAVVSEGNTAKAETTKADKPKADTAKKSDAKTASSQPGATQESQDQKDDAHGAAESGETVAVSYEDCKKLILAISQQPDGRPKVVALLQRFGAQKGPDLKEAQFADFVVDARRVEAGEWDPRDADALA